MSDSILKTVTMDLAKTSNDIPVEKSQQLEGMSKKEEKNDEVDDHACISDSVLIETSKAYEKTKDCGNVTSACNKDVGDRVLIQASQCQLYDIDNDDYGVADDILIKASQEDEEHRVSSGSRFGVPVTSEKLEEVQASGTPVSTQH